MNDMAPSTGDETHEETAPASARISRWAEQRIVKLEHALGENFKKMQTARRGARERLATALGQLDASLEASLLRGERTASGLLESARGALAKDNSAAAEPSTPAS
jgi:hypothetical protein